MALLSCVYRACGAEEGKKRINSTETGRNMFWLTERNGEYKQIIQWQTLILCSLMVLCQTSVMPISSSPLFLSVSHTQDVTVACLLVGGAIEISLFVSINSREKQNAFICGFKERKHLFRHCATRAFNEPAKIRVRFWFLQNLNQNTQVINVGTLVLQWGTNSHPASGFHCKEDVCFGLNWHWFLCFSSNSRNPLQACHERGVVIKQHPSFTSLR